MNRQMLDDFLSEDGDPGTRTMLLVALRLPPPMVVKELEFNHFLVRLHFEERQVLIEDDLIPGPEGQYRLSFDDFEKALRS